MTERNEVEEACARLRRVLVETRGLGRREFLAALGRATAGSALLAGLATLMGGAAEAAEPPVTVLTYGGAWKKATQAAYCDPFTKQTGIPVQLQEPYVFAKLLAMHQAKAQQIDASELSGVDIIVAGRVGMKAPLDWKVIDRRALSERQLRLPNAIGAMSQSMLVTYSTKKWPGADHPASWADFWNVEKFPGRRSLRRDPMWTIEAAMVGDGVAEKDFYPLDIERAFRALDRIKPHIKTWWSDNSQSQQLMEQEEVDLIMMTNGRAADSIVHHGAPFAIVWQGAVSDALNQCWILLTGCPNPAGGMKFLDLAGRAEPQAVFARALFYAPTNLKAFDLLDAKTAKLLPTYPANEKLAHNIDFEWWADNRTAVQRRFEQWLQS